MSTLALLRPAALLLIALFLSGCGINNFPTMTSR